MGVTNLAGYSPGIMHHVLDSLYKCQYSFPDNQFKSPTMSGARHHSSAFAADSRIA